MPRRTIAEFRAERAEGQAALMASDHLGIKRFLRLDSATYEDGALDGKTKELLGLVASMVLRCDDCIKYHLGQCHALGCTTEEIYEVFAIANLVGGSICIPHTRRGAEYWEELIKA